MPQTQLLAEMTGTQQVLNKYSGFFSYWKLLPVWSCLEIAKFHEKKEALRILYTKV